MYGRVCGWRKKPTGRVQAAKPWHAPQQWVKSPCVIYNVGGLYCGRNS